MAKQLKAVYLKDGGVIECQKFWKENGKVMVLVNRDVLVDLSQDEVDMKRTFKGHKPSKVRKPAAAKHEGGRPRSSGQFSGEQAGRKNCAGWVVRCPAESHDFRSEAGFRHRCDAKRPGFGRCKKCLAGCQVRGFGARCRTPRNRFPNCRQSFLQSNRPLLPAPALAGMLGMGTLLPFLLLLVLLIASFWKVFTKAGEAGWQSIIPLYNMFILVKISGKPWWWFLLMFIPVVGIIVLILVQMALAARFNRGPLFGLGLAFLGFIFYPVLAFDKSSYQ